MTTLSVADVLDRAADLLSKPGAWGQGMFGTYEGSTCWCAVGAIGHIVGLCAPSVLEAWVDKYASSFLGMTAEELEDWNDDDIRRQAEVVAKLREAATLSRSSENRNG